jgi:hypothetical protein
MISEGEGTNEQEQVTDIAQSCYKVRDNKGLEIDNANGSSSIPTRGTSMQAKDSG